MPTKNLNKLQNLTSDKIFQIVNYMILQMNSRTIKRQKNNIISEPVNIPFSLFLFFFQSITGIFLLNGSKARARRSTMER